MSDADDPAQLARRIVERVGDARVLVALDNDGTLSPIAPRPEDARLASGASDAIVALATVADVVIVSGRGLDDLADRFAGLPVELVAEHGLRHRTTDGTVLWLVDGLAEGTLERLRTELDELLPAELRRSGWLVEDKGVTVAVHHRLVADDALEPTLTRVREALDRAATTGGHVQTGKAVLELRPAGADKGAALRRLVGTRPDRSVVMVGDDLTDEPALAFAESQGGVGVLVAEDERMSAASARVADPEAVVALLDALAAALRRGR